MDLNSFEEDEGDEKTANAHRERFRASRKVLQPRQVRSPRGEHQPQKLDDSSFAFMPQYAKFFSCAIKYCRFLNPLQAIPLCHVNS